MSTNKPPGADSLRDLGALRGWSSPAGLGGCWLSHGQVSEPGIGQFGLITQALRPVEIAGAWPMERRSPTRRVIVNAGKRAGSEIGAPGKRRTRIDGGCLAALPIELPVLPRRRTRTANQQVKITLRLRPVRFRSAALQETDFSKRGQTPRRRAWTTFPAAKIPDDVPAQQRFL